MSAPITLYLRRRYFEHGTFSTLHASNGQQLCVCVEKPWQNNEANISCVPEGHYSLIPHRSHKFGECYALEAPSLGVTRHGPSQRTHILIHKANRVEELQGCIAPGKGFGVIESDWAVHRSGDAFDELMAELAGKEAYLVITRA